jgi:hypothetical protein
VAGGEANFFFLILHEKRKKSAECLCECVGRQIEGRGLWPRVGPAPSVPSVPGF